MAKTITAANSIFLLTIPGLYITPQQLQGYAADAAFDTEATEPVEVQMGVDGIMSAGYVPQPTKQTITLQADSQSIELFETWLATMKYTREVIFCNGSVTLPSVSRKYTATKGALTGYPGMPGVRKVLQPRTFTITWQDVSPAPF